MTLPSQYVCQMLMEHGAQANVAFTEKVMQLLNYILRGEKIGWRCIPAYVIKIMMPKHNFPKRRAMSYAEIIPVV